LSTAAETKPVAGEGENLTNKGQFVKFLSSLENDGVKQNSAELYAKYLNRIIEAGANLLDPESVKAAIAKKENWSNTTKALAVASCSKYLEFVGGVWKAPKYRTERKIPYVPTEREIDSLIDGAKRKLSAYLLLLKETGMRRSEAWGLKWKDADFERCGITLNDPLKHGTPRQFKVSNRLIAILNCLPKRSRTYIFRTDNQTARGFDKGLEHLAAAFRALRHRQALKLQNPNLERISFHTFRHWYATMQFNKTKNILQVQALLGHKDITTTTIYTHMVNFEADAYNTSVALNVDEARKLIEAGFEYVTGNYDDGGKIFRKLK
jgi:integrase